MGFTTDNGNVDPRRARACRSSNPVELETTISQIAGVVTVGLFARRGADVILIGTDAGVQTIDARRASAEPVAPPRGDRARIAG